MVSKGEKGVEGNKLEVWGLADKHYYIENR